MAYSPVLSIAVDKLTTGLLNQAQVSTDQILLTELTTGQFRTQV